MRKKPILCLDFDGVLHSYSSGWKGPRVIPDDPVMGALEFLVDALRLFDVHIYSSRSHYWGGRWAMRQWLRHQFTQVFCQGYEHTPKWAMNILSVNYEPWDLMVKDTANDLVKRLKFPRYKPPAMVTIDDRAMQFMGAFESPETYLVFEPWHRRK